MANKQITVSAKLDDKELLANLDKVNKKIKDMYSVNNQQFQGVQDKLRGMGVLGPSKEDEERSKRFSDLQKRSQTELTKLIKDQHSEAQKITKDVQDRIDKIDRLRAKEKELKDGSIEQLKLKEKIKNIETETLSVIDKQVEAQQKLAEAADALAAKQEKRSNFIKAGLASVGAVLGAYNQYNQIRTRQEDFKQATRAATGTLASQSPSGQTMSSIYRGDIGDMIYESPERSRAADLTMSKLEREQAIYSRGNVLSGLGASALAGGAAGSFLGGPIGSALGALGAAGTYMFSDMKRFNSLWDPESVQKQLMGEAIQNYNTNIDIEKAQDPLKFLARDEYNRNRQSNLSFQRTMGMSDEQMFGVRGIAGTGFLGSGLSQGITREELMGAADSVLGAGGSTVSARRNAVLVAQMQRAGMQNAGGIVGQLSGAIGNSKETESATIKVMAEGVRRGLDSSELRQENNRFNDIMASVISSSGVTSAAGAQNVSDYIGQFLSGKSMKSIEAIPSAMSYVESLQTGGQTPQGAIKASKIMSSSLLSGLSYESKTAISSAKGRELNVDSPEIKSMVAELQSRGDKRSSSEIANALVSEINNINKESVVSTARVQKSVESARSEFSQLQGTDSEKIAALERSGALGKVMMGLGSENTQMYNQLSTEGRKSVASYLIQNEGSSFQEAYEQAAKEGLTQKAGEQTLGQSELEGLAKQQLIVNENFLNMKTEMQKAADGAKEMTAAMFESALKFQEAVRLFKDGGADSDAFKGYMENQLRNPVPSRGTAGVPKVGK